MTKRTGTTIFLAVIAIVLLALLVASSMRAEKAEAEVSTLEMQTMELQVEEFEALTSSEDNEELEDYYPLTFEEWDYVYGVIAAELRNGSLEGMKMVAECIRDRALNGNYGKDIMSVMTAKNQFAKPYFGALSSNVNEAIEIDEKIHEAIYSVFVEGEYLFDEPILHFHADYIEAPGWTKGLTELARIDGTIFYN